jgi:hypothetical protein
MREVIHPTDRDPELVAHVADFSRLVFACLPRLDSLAPAESELLLQELYNLTEYLSCCDSSPSSFDERFHVPAIRGSIAIFMRSESPDVLQPILSILMFASGLMDDLSPFVDQEFLTKLCHCICAEDSPLTAQFCLSRLILSGDFFALRPHIFWIELGKRLTHEHQAAVLRTVASSGLPQDLFRRVTDQLLLCLLCGEQHRATVIDAAVSINFLVDHCPDGAFAGVKAVLEPEMPRIFDLISSHGFAEVYSMIQCCFFHDIGRDYLMGDGNIGCMVQIFRQALDSEDDQHVTRALGFLSVLVGGAWWEMPLELFEDALSVAEEGTYDMKHAAVLLVCAHVKRFDVPEELTIGFVTILLEMIMIPAMDIVDDLLECLEAAIRMQDGFGQYILWHWEDGFSTLCEKFDEIDEKIQGHPRAQDVGDRTEDIRHFLRKQMPRPYEDADPQGAGDGRVDLNDV